MLTFTWFSHWVNGEEKVGVSVQEELHSSWEKGFWEARQWNVLQKSLLAVVSLPGRCSLLGEDPGPPVPSLLQSRWGVNKTIGNPIPQACLRSGKKMRTYKNIAFLWHSRIHWSFYLFDKYHLSIFHTPGSVLNPKFSPMNNSNFILCNFQEK